MLRPDQVSTLVPRETRAAWEVPMGGGAAGRLKAKEGDPKELEEKAMPGGPGGPGGAAGLPKATNDDSLIVNGSL